MTLICVFYVHLVYN